MSLLRTIKVDGFNVEVHDFDYAQYYYPSFNGNTEFKVSSTGFKDLRRYLRTVKWADNIVSQVINN